MPINDAALERLQGLPPKLMLTADNLDALVGIGVRDADGAQQDLRWLSEQLPRLLEEQEARCQAANEMMDEILELTGSRRLVREQLAQAKEEVVRLVKFVDHCIKYSNRPFNESELTKKEARELVAKYLSPSEAEDEHSG